MVQKANLRNLSRPPLYEMVAEEVRRFIVDSKLQPGDKLPSERELCERLDVGRTSLREALRFLQMIGLIETRVGRGVYVQEIDVETYLNQTVKPVLDVSSELDCSLAFAFRGLGFSLGWGKTSF